jgi:hypothetical protein
MNRRRFTFWLGFGMFSVGYKLRMNRLDALAASMMKTAEPLARTSPTAAAAAPAAAEAAPVAIPVHWRAVNNEAWRWYERESFANGKWKISGVTTPINKQTGQPYAGRTGYLDESLVPEQLRTGAPRDDHDHDAELAAQHAAEFAKHHATEARRARHGRPPSKWLRSLYADELRIWLKTIDVPEADVSGMSFWTHLTRDHLFDADHIAGLTEPEQAKLHAAAHHGY